MNKLLKSIMLSACCLLALWALDTFIVCCASKSRAMHACFSITRSDTGKPDLTALSPILHSTTICGLLVRQPAKAFPVLVYCLHLAAFWSGLF